jgi:arginase
VSAKMTSEELLNILTGNYKENDVVGLTVVDFMPWDPINFKNTLSELDIFK